jgi:hypothetical protein
MPMRIVILFGLILSISFMSCEKVIDVSLKDSEKQYVIEGILTDREGDCVVSISKTKNFDDDNIFEGLGDAVVSVTDDEGNTTALPEATTGVYRSATLTATTGKAYMLEVNINGQTFSAHVSCRLRLKWIRFMLKKKAFLVKQ